MKRVIYTLLLLPSLLLAQTTTENYIVKKGYKTKKTDVNTLSSVPSDSVSIAIQYFDGLGRAKQSIAVRAGGNKEDIVTHFEYDEFGRQEKEYLPYAITSNDGYFRTGNQATITNQYYLDTYASDFIGVSLPMVNAYSEKTIEASPLNRVLEQAAPGADWAVGNGHTIKFDYHTNTSLEVKLYEVSLTSEYRPTLTGGTSSYGAGQLYKTITKDENWTVSDGLNHTTEEFKNKQGQVLLKRTYNANQKHDTYYVYDDYGNLTYVLPPKATDTAISQTILNELCYQYVYDYRNRLAEKKYQERVGSLLCMTI